MGGRGMSEFEFTERELAGIKKILNSTNNLTEKATKLQQMVNRITQLDPTLTKIKIRYAIAKIVKHPMLKELVLNPKKIGRRQSPGQRDSRGRRRTGTGKRKSGSPIRRRHGK